MSHGSPCPPSECVRLLKFKNCAGHRFVISALRCCLKVAPQNTSSESGHHSKQVPWAKQFEKHWVKLLTGFLDCKASQNLKCITYRVNLQEEVQGTHYFPNSSDLWTPLLWILHQRTLKDHAVIYFAVNNVSVIPVSENPRGTADVENKQIALLK